MDDQPFQVEDWHISLLTGVKKKAISEIFIWLRSARIILITVLLLVLGGWFWIEKFQWSDLSPNIFSELIGILVTVLLIDGLNERRAREELKKQLIREMCSSDNGIALRALGEFKAHGWATDGSFAGAIIGQANLQKAHLSGANLQAAFVVKANFKEANLSKVNFKEAILVGTNFEGATLADVNFKDAILNEVILRDAEKIKDEQLIQARSLRLAIMPNGNKYDGRFNLPCDLDTAHIWASIGNSDSKAMADFYGVSLDDYQQGQEWALKNISK